MFSLEEINSECLLKKSKYRIAYFEPDHFFKLKLNSFDKANIEEHGDTDAMISELMSKGHSFSFIKENKIIALFGFYELWKGTIELWLIPSQEIQRHKFAGHKASLRFFTFLAQKFHAKRLQFAVCCSNMLADNWANRCYFQKEGVMRKYSPDGFDYFLYSRIF